MRARVREIIFGTQTRAGRLFDVALIVLIVVSLLTISLESVASIAAEWGAWLRAAEWGITVLFTVEYALRLWCVDRPWAYARSFFGVVDLLSIVPGFTSIPRAVYWAVVTMTTVGYGDIAPETPLGQALAALVMILGYGVLAVPTGIVSAELVHVGRQRLPAPRPCPGCGLEDHATDAAYCRRCGSALAGTPES
jgi:voltage-gated potassium channel Kch